MWYVVASAPTSPKSLITTPWKPSRLRSSSVKRKCEAVAAMPLIEPEVTITVPAPASMAPAYDGRNRSCR